MSPAPAYLATWRAKGTFEPLDTINGPSPGRNMQYKRASTTGPSQRFSNTPIHNSPPNSDSRRAFKRLSIPLPGSSKRIKANDASPKTVPSHSHDLISSEDELQDQSSHTKHRTQASKTPDFYGQEWSYRRVDTMMSPAQKSATSRTRSKSKQANSPTGNDELQDQYEDFANSYSRKPVVTSQKAHNTFRAEDEENTALRPESPNSQSAELNAANPSQSSKLRNNRRRSTNIDSVSSSQKHAHADTQHRVTPEEPLVQDSQPSESNGHNESAVKASERSNTSLVAQPCVPQEQEKSQAKSKQTKAAAEPNVEEAHSGHTRFKRRNKLNSSVNIDSDLSVKYFCWNGQDWEGGASISMDAPKIKFKARNSTSLDLIVHFPHITKVFAGDGEHMIITGKRDHDVNSFVAHVVAESADEQKQFKEKLKGKITSWFKLQKGNFTFDDTFDDEMLQAAYDKRSELDDPAEFLENPKQRKSRPSRNGKGIENHTSSNSPAPMRGEGKALSRWENKPYTEYYYREKTKWGRALQYPPSGASKATVEFDELRYLDSEEWLNDSLIWFGLKYLFSNRLEPKQPIYYFNTYFYQALTMPSSKSSSKDNPRSPINYKAVQRWTSKFRVDIFDFDHIVVPINLDSHWFLAIISNPERMLVDEGEIVREYSQLSLEPNDSPVSDIQPMIITLDSMGSPQPTVVRNLKQYLRLEAFTQRGKDIMAPRSITARGIPQQTNGCDCGLFLIEYVERFLQDPNTFVDRVVTKQMNLDYWPNTIAEELRDDFRELVLREGYEQSGISLQIKPEEKEPENKKPEKKEPNETALKLDANDDGDLTQEYVEDSITSEVPNQPLSRDAQSKSDRKPKRSQDIPREPRVMRSTAHNHLHKFRSNQSETEAQGSRPPTRGKDHGR